MTTVLEKLVETVRKAAEYNSASQVAPNCILWPDGDRQFESALPLLLKAMPEMLVLGNYDAEKRTGPAIWIRCALGGTIDGFDPKAATPIIYLPGVGRGDLRLVETLREEIRPLAYYAFRGAVFQQKNGKDWTALSFLVSKDGGLGLEVAADMSTRSSLMTALPKVLESSVDELSGGQLDSGDFDHAIVGGDSDKLILQWLNGGDAWRKQQSDTQWKAFMSICKKNYTYNPEKDGQGEGLRRLASRVGAWKNVYERYEESYVAYDQILPTLKLQTPPPFNMFDTATECGGWPQWNEVEEKLLLEQIKKAADEHQSLALKTLKEAENRHGARRRLVWAKMGLSPLAIALKELVDLGERSLTAIPTCATYKDFADWYENTGWRVDRAARMAVAKAGKSLGGSVPVKGVVRNFYKPWLESVNNTFQKYFEGRFSYPDAKHPDKPEGSSWCIFADGLRFDVAKELQERIEAKGFVVEESLRWAPIPTITACGKPCAVPGAKPLGSYPTDGDGDYDPLKGVGTTFAKYLSDNGYTESKSPAEGESVWWAKGDIDTSGHDYGEDLPIHIPGALDSIVQCVVDAFGQGAKTVQVVTDHGWLWLPGSLKKYDVPTGLTMAKSTRFAEMKAGVSTNEVQLGWSWNPNSLLAFAPGICSHVNGKPYTHGGLSLQECRLIDLKITRVGGGAGGAVGVKETGWRGVRFTFALTGDFSSCKADFRADPIKGDSLVAGGAKNVDQDGIVTGLIAEEELMGASAYFVVVDDSGNIKAQSKVVIGGEE